MQSYDGKKVFPRRFNSLENISKINDFDRKLYLKNKENNKKSRIFYFSFLKYLS